MDGIYVKAGLEKDKAALLVVLAALSNGQKVVLAVVPEHPESTANWSVVLRDLKARGLRGPRLVIGDGHLGIWAGLRHVYPEVKEQRCWNHKILNVLDVLPKREQAETKSLLCQIPFAPTRQEAEPRQWQFLRWGEQRGQMAAPPVSRTRLGPSVDLLSLSTTPRATSAHHESREIPLCLRSTADRCGQAAQEGCPGHRLHLEHAHSGGTDVPTGETSGTDGRRLSRNEVY